MTAATLEDRLRAHFADRAERELLDPPDPARVVAGAAARAGSANGAGADVRPLPTRRWSIAAVGAVAAACLAVVAAVALAGDDPDTTDIGNTDTTVTTERPEPTTTTVPETSTSTPSTTSATPPPVTSLIVSWEGVLGEWDGSAWVRFGAERPPADGGENYQVVRLGHPVTTVTGPVPQLEECAASETYRVDLGLREFALAGENPVGVRGVPDVLPRSVTVLDPSAPEYREAARQVLATLGVDAPDPQVRQVVRVDLDGDGVDEVLVQAQRVNENLWAESGDYAVVFLRRVVGGRVQDSVVASGVPGPAEPGSGLPASAVAPFIVVPHVAAVADLNGDGRMEVVLGEHYYEGGSTVAYELRGDGLAEVLRAGCGV
jgi:hypothetical protein